MKTACALGLLLSTALAACATILALTLPDAHAEPPPRTELPFETKQQPFVPRLLISSDEPLCGAFLSALRKDFLARHRGNSGLFKEPTMTVGHWMAWPPEPGWPGPGGFGRAEVDLDQDGKKQLLVHVTMPFNSNGNWYWLLIRSKTTTDGLADEIAEFEKLPPPKLQTASLTGVAIADLPMLWGWGAYNGFGSPFKVLSYQGRFYLYTFVDGIFERGGEGAPDGTASLRRIHADGSLDVQCRASVAPRAGALPLPIWRGPSNPPDTLQVPLEVAEWMQTIREMQGTEGRWSGTLHSLNGLIIRSSYTWYDALVRPWEVSTGPSLYPSAVALRSWIAQWGFESLSQFRLARRFESGRRDALVALAKYYEDSFGISNGEEAASAAIDNIIAASFVVHGTYGPNPEYSDNTLEKEADALRRRVDDFVGGRAPAAAEASVLRSALLIGIPPTAIDSFIKAGTKLGGEPKRWSEVPEPMLFYALEHPDEARALLDGGSDINEGNTFGKTALMYAAHYDLADTVTLLLARGADVTKRTNAPRESNTLIQFDGRTALMYASENASIRVIRALIEAGSDTCAMDTGDRNIWSYVQRNRRLSNDDRARAALLIAQRPCTSEGPDDRAR